MTASLRGLVMCSALVMLLALAWVLGGRRDEGLRSPQVLVLVPAEVRELRVITSAGTVPGASSDSLLVRRRGGGGGWESDRGAPVKAAAVEDLLGVVAAARWHRRDDVARAGAIAQMVMIDGTPIGVGQALGEQRWLTVRGQALLVDGWVARVLLVEPAALLDRAIFPDAARAPVIEAHASATPTAPWQTPDLVLQGDAQVSPWRYLLDPRKARRLRDELSALELLPGAPSDQPGAERPLERGEVGAVASWSIRVAQGPGGEATLSGGAIPCPTDDQAVVVESSRLGRGCLARAQLVQLGQGIDQTARLGAEERPFGADAMDVMEWQLSDGGGSLRMWRDGGRWQAQRGGEDAPFVVEDAAVEAALAPWTSPWTSSFSSRSSPPAKPVQTAGASSGTRTLRAQRRDGAVVSLTVAAAREAALLARRDGEDLVLTAPPALVSALGGSLAALTPTALATQLLPLTLWQLEPTSISRLVLDGRALRRGAVLGEWLDERSGQPLVANRAAAVEELVTALAGLRARSRAPHGSRAAHRLELWIAADPSRSGGASPATARDVHRVELNAQRGECLGRGDGAEARFEAKLCEQVSALAALLR